MTKNINFTGKYAKNENFGINFEVEVTQKIICRISQEALQDIDPENRYSSEKKLFESNRAKFEIIAEKKIQNIDNTILIISDDVR